MLCLASCSLWLPPLSRLPVAPHHHSLRRSAACVPLFGALCWSPCLSLSACLGAPSLPFGAMSLVSLLFSSCCTALRPCWSLSFLVLVALLRGLVRLLAWPVPWFVWFRFLRCLPLAGLSVSLLSVGCFGALGLALLHAVLVHLYFLHLPVLLNSWASLYLCVCPLIGQVHLFFFPRVWPMSRCGSVLT